LSSLHSRHLDWEGTINARDSGGLAAAEGAVRHGALIRSDVLNDLTPAGQAALIAHGVRTVIDVRAADEIADAWDRYPFREHDLVKYRNLPFSAGTDAAMGSQVRAVYAAAQSREEINRLDLDNHRAGICAIVAAIAEAPPGGVLVHCHAGKDRTGIVIALTLSVVGVSDDEIADDYALTQLVLEPLLSEWFEYMGADGAPASEHARLRALADPRREAMLDTLSYLRRHYGSAEEYLLGGGVSAEQLKMLRERLVEPRPVGVEPR
jgi:protein-tyrosine phosphatase